MESFISQLIFSTSHSLNPYRLMHFLYFISLGRIRTVGEYNTIRAEVAVIRSIAEISSEGHIIIGTVRSRHLNTLIYPIPDKTADKCRITFISLPIFLKVSNCISHCMGILTDYMRFHSFSILRFLQPFLTYTLQPLHIGIHRAGYITIRAISFIMSRTGIVEFLNSLCC